MHLRIDVRAQDNGRLVCVDNLRIQPAVIGHAIDGVGYMEGASHMGSILILGAHSGGDYIASVRETVEKSGLARVGVTSGNRHGVSWLMVRALADSTDQRNDPCRQ